MHKALILAASPQHIERALAASKTYGMSYGGVSSPDHAPTEYAFVLWYADDGVSLLNRTQPKQGAVRVDFSTGTADYRRQHGGGRGELIAKAVGIKKDYTPHIIDATTGLGGDAFVLANLGCTLQLYERAPIAHALLQDGLDRALQTADIAHIAARMQLYWQDAHTALHHTPPADVVYLDPMFPDKSKSALAKKTMQAFQHCIGDDADAAQLLRLAQYRATKRVVVKRPRHGAFLADTPPAYQYLGKSTRFDVYLPL